MIQPLAGLTAHGRVLAPQPDASRIPGPRAAADGYDDDDDGRPRGCEPRWLGVTPTHAAWSPVPERARRPASKRKHEDIG